MPPIRPTRAARAAERDVVSYGSAREAKSRNDLSATSTSPAQPTLRRPVWPRASPPASRRTGCASKESLATRGGRAPRSAGADRRTLTVPWRGTSRRH